MLQSPRWEKKLGQIVLGRWVFLRVLHREVLMLMCPAPLLQSDLRAGYDEQVSCSDASGKCGAAAISSGLTWSGQSLTSSLSDQRLQPVRLPILPISVFDGIGGAFRIYNVLGVAVEAAFQSTPVVKQTG